MLQDSPNKQHRARLPQISHMKETGMQYSSLIILYKQSIVIDLDVLL